MSEIKAWDVQVHHQDFSVRTYVVTATGRAAALQMVKERFQIHVDENMHIRPSTEGAVIETELSVQANKHRRRRK